MSDLTAMPTDGVTLFADGLESKWGFSDGDLIIDWWPDLPVLFDTRLDHDVLVDLVRTHLVPVIEAAGHSVELSIIETIHNPIRARSIDGREVDDYGCEPGILRGLNVTVSAAQIWASVARAKASTR